MRPPHPARGLATLSLGGGRVRRGEREDTGSTLPMARGEARGAAAPSWHTERHPSPVGENADILSPKGRGWGGGGMACAASVCGPWTRSMNTAAGAA
jgi:hypothetical protein